MDGTSSGAGTEWMGGCVHGMTDDQDGGSLLAPWAAPGLRCSGPWPGPTEVPGEGAEHMQAANDWPGSHPWTRKQDRVALFLLNFSPSYYVTDLLVLHIHSGSQRPEVVLGKRETI